MEKGSHTYAGPPDICSEPAPPALVTGIEEFNRGEYFECHETLEALWLAEPGPIRKLYQGILQIGVAFHHLQRGRFQPVVTLLERGSGYLRPFAPACMGVDIKRLLADAGHCLAEVERLGATSVNSFDWSGVPSVKIID